MGKGLKNIYFHFLNFRVFLFLLRTVITSEFLFLMDSVPVRVRKTCMIRKLAKLSRQEVQRGTILPKLSSFSTLTAILILSEFVSLRAGSH